MGEQTAILQVQQAAGGGPSARLAASTSKLGLAAIDRRHVDPGQIAEQEVLSIGKEKRVTGVRRVDRRAAWPPATDEACHRTRQSHDQGAAYGWLIHDLTVDAPGRATRLRSVGERLWGTSVQRDALQLPIQERDQRPPIGREDWLQAGYVVLSDQRIGQAACWRQVPRSRTHNWMRPASSGAQNATVLPSGEIAGAACV